MAELHVIKSGFDGCYDSLIALSTRLHETSSFTLEPSADTSQTGDRERQCYDALLKMFSILATLAEETAQDVKLTKERYVLADEAGGR